MAAPAGMSNEPTDIPFLDPVNFKTKDQGIVITK